MLIGIDISRALRPKPTGTERYSLEIVRHLARLPEAAQHQWRFYIDTPAEPHLIPKIQRRLLQPWPDNAEICTIPPRRLWTHRSLAKEVMRNPPSVLFIPAHVIPFHWSKLLPIVPPIGKRLPPSVVTIHDLGYRYFPESHTRFQRWYLNWSTKWSTSVAQKVIAVSKATAKDIQWFYEIDASKIQVIYEAATGQQERPSENKIAATRQRYSLDKPYAFYIGTIQPRKNLRRLIEAYAELCKYKQIHVDLVLGGEEGWMSQSLYELADSISDQVRLLGYVSDADLPSLMAGAQFFCFPSLFEGFGLPVLEAQQYGTPVMTANNSSLPEIAGDAALLVDPNDVNAIAQAMLTLSRDEQLRQRLIAAGYENVKRFSWEKAAKETLAVLEEAAGTAE